jgi:chromosome segregation ATPase
MCDPYVEELQSDLAAIKGRCAHYRNETLRLRDEAAMRDTMCAAQAASAKKERAEHRKQLAAEMRAANSQVALLMKRMAAQDKEMERVKASALVTAQDLQKVKKLHVVVVDQCDRLSTALEEAVKNVERLERENMLIERLQHENMLLEGQLHNTNTVLTLMEHKVRCCDARMQEYGFKEK